MLDFETAYWQLMSAARPAPAAQAVPLSDCGGRVLSRSYSATSPVPPFDNSAMDGYAVRAAEVQAGAAMPVSQRVPAGAAAAALAPGTVARIFTGAMLPAGADAVILQEDTQKVAQEDAGLVRFSQGVQPGANVRPAGEDFEAGALLAQQGDVPGPATVARLAAAGVAELDCHRRMRVAFFSSGDELAEPGQPREGAAIYNSNRFALREQLVAAGAEAIDLGQCPDDFQATREFLLRAAAQADCVISTGGMSVGEEDYVRRAAEAVGSIDFWKIALKPGKPLAFGKVGGAAFFGLPGNPVSAFVTFVLLVKPWLLKSSGVRRWQHVALYARAEFELVNRGRRLDFQRATLQGNASGELRVTRYPRQGSGVISSLVDANALLPVAPGSQIQPGNLVPVIALGDPFGIEGGIEWPPLAR